MEEESVDENMSAMPQMLEVPIHPGIEKESRNISSAGGIFQSEAPRHNIDRHTGMQYSVAGGTTEEE